MFPGFVRRENRFQWMAQVGERCILCGQSLLLRDGAKLLCLYSKDCCARNASFSANGWVRCRDNVEVPAA